MKTAWFSLLIVIAGCRPSPEPSATTSSASSSSPAGSSESAPTASPDASSSASPIPLGKTYSFTYREPKVGDRTRWTSHETLDPTMQDVGGARLPKTASTYTYLLETLELADGHPSKIKITVEASSQTLGIRSQPSRFQGHSYMVTTSAKEATVESRDDGEKVGKAEQALLGGTARNAVQRVMIAKKLAEHPRQVGAPMDDVAALLVELGADPQEHLEDVKLTMAEPETVDGKQLAAIAVQITEVKTIKEKTVSTKETGTYRLRLDDPEIGDSQLAGTIEVQSKKPGGGKKKRDLKVERQ